MFITRYLNQQHKYLVINISNEILQLLNMIRCSFLTQKCATMIAAKICFNSSVENQAG